MTDLGILTIQPEGWTLMTAVAVAVLGGTASVRAAKIARQATRDAAKASPYEALAARVVQLEGRVQEQDEKIEQQEARIVELGTELRTEREKSAHLTASFRTRIQVLLRFIASQDEFIEALLNIVRLHQIPMGGIPKKPELPQSAADEL